MYNNETMNFWMSYGFMGICMLISVALSVGGLLFVRKWCRHFMIEAHHAVAGPFLSIIGTLYAVVLGFIVVDALNNFQRARVIVEEEANGVHDVFHLSQGLNEPARTNLRQLCIDYCDVMPRYEWPAMEYGYDVPQGHNVFTKIWHTVCSYQTKTPSEETFLSEIADELKSIGDARHSRLLAAQPSFDPALAALLIVGAVVTILFTYFFAVENLLVQILMTSLVAVVVTMNLVVVALFDSPFSGDVKVSPRAFLITGRALQAELNEK